MLAHPWNSIIWRYCQSILASTERRLGRLRRAQSSRSLALPNAIALGNGLVVNAEMIAEDAGSVCRHLRWSSGLRRR